MACEDAPHPHRSPLCAVPPTAPSSRSRWTSATVGRLAAACLVLWLGSTNPAGADGDDRALGPDLRVSSLEDRSGALSFEDVLELGDRFVPGTDSMNHGFTASAHWLRFRLARPERDEPWLLEIGYPLLDRIDLHLLYDDDHLERFRSGDSLPFDERPIKHRTFVFPIEFDAGRTSVDVYARVLTDSSMQLPLEVWTPEEFHARKRDEQLLFGLFYGLLLAILLYNALLALSVREIVYAYYASYVLCYGLLQMCLNGLSFEYLWPNSTYLAAKGTLIFMPLTAMLSALFSREILEITPRRPRLRRAFDVYVVCSAAGLPIAFALPYAVAIQAQALSAIAGTLLYACAGVISYRDGVAAARFYLLAWSLFLVGVFVYALKTYGVLPENALTEYTVQVGSAFEVILLSFAIAHRFKIMRERTLSAERESTALLEQRVAERTATLEGTLAQLSTANARLETLSITDALTGLFNRAHFNARFETMWREAARAQNSIAVLMIDIDRFKAVNDEYGHLVGDAVITNVGRSIADSLNRPGDLLARYGGEELVVVLSCTASEGAVHVAERLRVAVLERAADLPDGVGPERVSVSIGVAAEVPDPRDPSARCEALLDAADTALYRAKREGRNRVRLSEDDFPEEVRAIA